MIHIISYHTLHLILVDEVEVVVEDTPGHLVQLYCLPEDSLSLSLSQKPHLNMETAPDCLLCLGSMPVRCSLSDSPAVLVNLDCWFLKEPLCVRLVGAPPEWDFGLFNKYFAFLTLTINTLTHCRLANLQKLQYPWPMEFN